MESVLYSLPFGKWKTIILQNLIFPFKTTWIVFEKKNTKEKNRARRKTTENLFGISKRRTITLQNVYPTHKVDKDLAKCVHSVRRKDRGDQRKKEKRPIYNLQISPWRFYEEALFSIICSGMLKTHTHTQTRTATRVSNQISIV